MDTARRNRIIKKIQEGHKGAQKDAMKWCVTHPLKGLPALYSLFKGKEISEDVVRAWQSVPSWQNYLDGYDELLELERMEGFPAMKKVSHQVSQIGEVLQSTGVTKGYYPFAGTDFFWARIFNEITFEDVGYWKEYTKNMWWRPETYSYGSLVEILDTMREAGVLDGNEKIRMIQGDSYQKRKNNEFNSSDTALIIGGGHSVVGYLQKRYGDEPLLFGSMVFVNPISSRDSLIAYVGERGYDLIEGYKTEPIFAPFTMGMCRQFIFAKP